MTVLRPGKINWMAYLWERTRPASACFDDLKAHVSPPPRKRGLADLVRLPGRTCLPFSSFDPSPQMAQPPYVLGAFLRYWEKSYASHENARGTSPPDAGVICFSMPLRRDFRENHAGHGATQHFDPFAPRLLEQSGEGARVDRRSTCVPATSRALGDSSIDRIRNRKSRSRPAKRLPLLDGTA